jgi:hypothetical protein
MSDEHVESENEFQIQSSPERSKFMFTEPLKLIQYHLSTIPAIGTSIYTAGRFFVGLLARWTDPVFCFTPRTP